MNVVIQSVFSHMKDQSVAVLFSGKSPLKSADQSYPFQVSKNFYYATGLAHEDLILVLIKGNQLHARLYSLIKTPLQEKWEGFRPTFEVLKTKSGVHDIRGLNTFEEDFTSLLSLGRDASYGDMKHVYVDLASKERAKTHELSFATNIIPLYPEIKIEPFGEIFRTLRTIKSDNEISHIKKAIDITNDALDVVLNQLKYAKNELDVHALFQYEIHKKGSQESFHTIAASGVQATVLHYHDNNQQLVQGQLILLDLGATHQEYNADISRTYPVSGVFSPRQKVLYQMVLDVNKEMIAWIKPGYSIQEFKDAGKKLLAKKALAIGLIDKEEDIIKYYYHGLGHHLGLDVHDFCDQQMLFKEGMVITVEPGIYIEEERIGIRIEDDCLITKEGAINLSAHIIKEIKDIEFVMANKNK